MSILIDADTTFIVQGITGREAVNLTRECLDYGAGAKIVGPAITWGTMPNFSDPVVWLDAFIAAYQ